MVRHPFRAFAVLALLVLAALSIGPRAVAVSGPRSNEWWFPVLNVEERLWPITEGRGVTVAELDTGVNGTMPEIGAALLSGGDTTGQGTDGRTDLDKVDGGHGTSMAVLIAGQGGGRSRLVGVAPQAKILPVVVNGGTATNAPLNGPLAEGIRFAVDHGAQVINMSQGSPSSQSDPFNCPRDVMGAVSYAVKHDVVLVAGAGNSGTAGNPMNYPASCPGVLAVGAVDSQSNPWRKTESQDYVSVAAPGVDMPTSGSNPAVYYPHSDGTSNATALVSAGAALVRAANPTMSAREVVRRIIGTAGSGSGSYSHDNRVGYGEIAIFRAIDPNYSIPPNSPNPPYQRFDAWQAAQSRPTAPRPTNAPSSPTAPPVTSSGHSPDTTGTTIVFAVFGVITAGGVLMGMRGARRAKLKQAGAGPQMPPPSVAPPPAFGGGNRRPDAEPPSDN